jgi:glycogen synthase
MMAKLAYGIPLVITTHSLELLRPWKREQIGRGYEVSSWVEKTALEMADALVAVSSGMKEDILRLFNVKPERVHVIYNGVDTAEFKPVTGRESLYKYGINPDEPYVLCLGRVTRQKGIIHLVNAIQYLDPRLQVVLAAGQPDTKEIGREMEEKVRQVQETRKNIIWIREWIGLPAKVELYSHATVFCCPSIYEPFGIINLEAMACGTPVVGSAVGGIKEIIRHGETGFLVPLEQHQKSPFEAANPDRFSRDLAAPINRIANEPGLRAALGAASRDRAVADFSWRSIALKTLELYRTLAG